MDESGILGQMILDAQGNIKSTNGSLSEQSFAQYFAIIMSSAAKLIDNPLNRITISYQETDLILYVDSQDIVILEKKRL